MEKTNKPFARALGDLVRERQNDPVGRVNLKAFLATVKGTWGYEGLRAMVTGTRTLQPEAIEAIAEALGIDPRYFREYRQHLLLRRIEAHPEVVDDIWAACATYIDAIDEVSEQNTLSAQKGGNRRRSARSGDQSKVD